MATAVLEMALPQHGSLSVLGDVGDAPLAHWEEIEWEFPEKTNDLSFLKELTDSGDGDGSWTPATYASELEANPYSVKLWMLLLDSAKSATLDQRFRIYERAVAVLPRSYKLWYHFLQERMAHAVAEPITSPAYGATNNAFERCLVHLSQAPRIWLLYLEFLQLQPLVTRCRRCFDRALQSLPITQHHRIWPEYIAFVERVGVPELSIAVYSRYLMLEPSKVGLYIDLLKRLGRIDEAATVLAKTLSGNSVSVEGKTTHQLWYALCRRRPVSFRLELCDLVAQNPTEIQSIDVEKILRSGLRRFTTEVAMLWCGLANHYVLLGQMDKARDVYEEALATVITTYDFGVIFDAYAKFMESMLTTLMNSEEADPVEVDLYLARLESLIQRRSLLLSSVKLRQNPHNVVEWLNRVRLFKDDIPKVIATYTEALITIDPFQAVGRLPLLWIHFAQLYERHGDMQNVRAVYERAVAAKYRSPEDLATLWCSWIELELRHKNYKAALEVARRSIHRPGATSIEKGRGYYQRQMARNVRLWSLCLDLEESLGTSATLAACVEKMMDLKVITPAQLLNYTTYLEEKKFWEESFRIYERGLSLFRWPYVYDVWITYLAKFVSRYGGSKLERARELFEQALVDAPPHLSKRLFLMYGKLEEEFGLARHAIAVYDRATRTMTDPEQIYEFYSLLLAKTTEFFGATQTREVYERGIEKLAETDASIPYAISLCLRYSDLEKSLGEIDRARSILQHCSQFCDPKTRPEFWQVACLCVMRSCHVQKWRDFEVAHGNEDLFREMLRIKRSVQAVYSQSSIVTRIPEALPTPPPSTTAPTVTPALS